MRTAQPRTRAAKAVAQERKYPRAMKGVVLAYHQDEKQVFLKADEEIAERIGGKVGDKIPAVIRTFRVAPFDKVEVFIDRSMIEHQRPLKEGELDWSSGAVTVGEQEYDEEGNCIQILHLSHDKQRQHLFRDKNHSYADGKIVFGTRAARSPNAYVPRFNIMIEGPKRAPILNRWQMQADSPDAFWLDGKAPTQEQVNQQTKEREEARDARRRGSAVTNTPQPVAVSDEEGEDFSGDLDT